MTETTHTLLMVETDTVFKLQLEKLFTRILSVNGGLFIFQLQLSIFSHYYNLRHESRKKNRLNAIIKTIFISIQCNLHSYHSYIS